MATANIQTVLAQRRASTLIALILVVLVAFALTLLLGLLSSQVPATTSSRQPNGVPGDWKLSFDDEFNGTSLNTSAWSTHDGWTNQNGVTDEASNVSVSGGYANLTLSSATTGAAIASNSARLEVGDFAEARISMPGSGSTMDDWDAFWSSGPAWPAAGENDVTETFGGQSTVNYHSPSGAHNEGAVSGNWGGAFHTYGIYRGSDYVDVYYGGALVKSYSTDDDGKPQILIFTVGTGQDDPIATGAAGTMKVDYLRVWRGTPSVSSTTTTTATATTSTPVTPTTSTATAPVPTRTTSAPIPEGPIHENPRGWRAHFAHPRGEQH